MVCRHVYRRVPSCTDFFPSVSTNQRVQNFAWFSLFSLIGLGIWQIFHLRAFFRRKYLID